MTIRTKLDPATRKPKTETPNTSTDDFDVIPFEPHTHRDTAWTAANIADPCKSDSTAVGLSNGSLIVVESVVEGVERACPYIPCRRSRFFELMKKGIITRRPSAGREDVFSVAELIEARKHLPKK
jgi:hypothetical protein